MTLSAEQSDLDMQRILRAEIRDLRFRHALELELVHLIYDLAANGPGPGLPPLENQIELVTKSRFFDEDWYLEKNPDVTKSDMYAAEHYVRAGAFEGRDPGPDFRTIPYYLANPDTAKAKWPALVHYAHVGEAEGRPLA